TFLGQISFLSMCGVIAYLILGSTLSFVALGLIVILPNQYGSDYVFSYLETFATPRIFAEALTLASLAALMIERRLLCLLFLVLAFAIHPIMAMGGAAFICARIALNILSPRALAWTMAAATLLVVLLGLLALSTEAAHGLRFDSSWFQIVNDRSPYLF